MSITHPLFAVTAFVLLWNSGFIGAEYGLPYADTFTFLCWRYAILSGLLLLYLMIRQQLPRRDLNTIAHVAFVGVLAHAVWLSCVFLSLQQDVPAGVVALIVALQPLATGAFSGLVVGERTSLLQWVGLSVGFAGVAIAVVSRLQLNTEISIWGYILPFGSVVAITIASLLQRRRDVLVDRYSPLPIVETLFYQSLATTVAVALPAIFLEGFVVQWTMPFVLTLGWLIIALSIGAYGLMWHLIAQLDATRVASLFYLGPPVTMIMAWFAFGDVPQIADLIGLAVVVIGVLLVNWPNSQRN